MNDDPLVVDDEIPINIGVPYNFDVKEMVKSLIILQESVIRSTGHTRGVNYRTYRNGLRSLTTFLRCSGRYKKEDLEDIRTEISKTPKNYTQENLEALDDIAFELSGMIASRSSLDRPPRQTRADRAMSKTKG